MNNRQCSSYSSSFIHSSSKQEFVISTWPVGLLFDFAVKPDGSKSKLSPISYHYHYCQDSFEEKHPRWTSARSSLKGVLMRLTGSRQSFLWRVKCYELVTMKKVKGKTNGTVTVLAESISYWEQFFRRNQSSGLINSALEGLTLISALFQG